MLRVARSSKNHRNRDRILAMLRFVYVRNLSGTSITKCPSSSFREFSTSTLARLSRFRQAFRTTPQRRPVAAPKVREDVKPEHHYPDQIPVRPASHLWKALAFTAGVGCVSYTAAAVSEYERFKQKKRDIYSFFTDFTIDNIIAPTDKRTNKAVPDLTPGQKVALAIVGINCAVTLLWRVPQLRNHMYRYFTNSFASKSLCSPMLLSVFSHNNLIHLAVNMYVLYSFVPVSTNQFLGVDQFVALYLTSGVVSSFTSLVHKSAVRSNMRALGASGAICAVLAYTCMKIPHAKLSIIFMPFFQFDAQTAVYGLIAFDLIGLIFRFRMFDHAAHLGGTLFGLLYALYGEHWIRRHFNPLVFKACEEADKKK